MKIVIEDLWLPAGMHIVTTNSTFDRNGFLVMGKGAALQAKQKYPWAPDMAAEAILFKCDGHLGVYGFTSLTPNLGIFQVKKHWRDPALLFIIEKSVKDLARYANNYAWKSFRMNFPGIGAGGLKIAEVEPLLRALPDNVTICMR